MYSMLKQKRADDPHDILVVPVDAIKVAPVDEAVVDPAYQAVRSPLEPEIDTGDVSAGAAIPPVDTTFRATAVNDVRVDGRHHSSRGRGYRGLAALLLAASIGGAGIVWQAHGDAVQRLIAEWAPSFAQKSSRSPEKPAPATAPELAATETDAAQAGASVPAAPESAALSPEQAQLQSMAHALASAGQEIEQLKASIEQLKSSQQQLMASVSEKAAGQGLRPKKPAPPPRPVAALTQARKPPPFSPRQAVGASTLPPAAAYVPRQPEPQASAPAAAAPTDPELASVPRPPMPLR